MNYPSYSLKKLGVNFQSGYAFKSNTFKSYGVPLIKIGNIQNNIVKTNDSGNFISTELIFGKVCDYLLNDRDILIAMTGQGSVGRVGMLRLDRNEKALLNQRVGRFIFDERNSHKDYIYYILTSPFFQQLLFQSGVGSGQPNLSPDIILNLEIPAPSYSEQKAIASVLSSLDDKIDLLHRQNKTLESMSEIIFRQCFIVNEQEQWVNGTIEDLYVLQRGFDLPSNQRVSGKFNLYAASGLNDNIDSYKVDYPTIITGRSGVIGKVYYSLDKSWPLNTTLYIKDFKIAAFWFAYFHLKMLDLSSLNSGSAVPTLNRNHVHSLEVKLPPKDLISKFEDDVSAFMIKLNENLKQIIKLEKLRDTLLPKLMSGEVRVQDAKEAIVSVA